MSVGGIGRVCVRSDIDEKTTTMFTQRSSSKREGGGTKSRFTGNCSTFRLPKRSELSPMKYLKHVGHKMAAALRLVSRRRRGSPKVSSSQKAKTCVAPVDSHRAEAIDDCIEFINSSSSLQRSNSVSC
ncbi:unnamed protein product [Ilex paraguariensis]|uniref:Josephin-like protein n=1 Tax=Ilex paraguariensis TaxID=185542 RepID=A0ABC8R279_9AQUA